MKKYSLLTFLMIGFMLGGCSGVANPQDETATEEKKDDVEKKEDEKPVHTHTWATDWTTSSSQHWHKCTDSTCKEVNDKANHTFGDVVVVKYAYDDANFVKQNGNGYKECSVCHYHQNVTIDQYDPNASQSTGYQNKFTRSYTIFESAPEIRFQTTSTASNVMEFATKPRKSSNIEPWEVAGTFTTTNCESKYDIGAVAGGMKVRGNYTTDYEKKGFRLKFDKKVNLFGLNGGQKYKKWVVFADVKDNSMLRNAVSYYLGRNMVQDNVFVTDSTPVHIYINNQYWGLYLLAEQKEAKTGRIDLPELPSDDYSGTDIGYSFEIDKYASEEAAKGLDGDPTFTINPSPTFTYSPHSGENRYNCNGFTNTYTMLTDIGDRNTQVPFIKNRVEQLYQVLYYAAYQNQLKEIVDNAVVNSTETDVETCLAKSFDIDSFVNLYILNEVVINPDIGYSSFYLSYDNSAEGDKKLRLDNPWDFDTALGVRAGTVENAQGMFASKSSNMWLSMMARMSWFTNKVKARWNELRTAKLFEKALDMIDDFSYTYKADYAKNYERWPKTLGSNNETNHETRRLVQGFKSQKEAENLVYTYLVNRVDYLEAVWGTGRDSLDPTVGTDGDRGGSSGGGSTQQQTVDYTEFKAAANKTRYEAESAALAGGASTRSKTDSNISNNSYVGGMDGSSGQATITFTVNSTKACEALLGAGFSARTTQKKFGDLFSVSVNGSSYTGGNDITVPAGNGTNGEYQNWTYLDIGKINLNNGSNTIVIKATSSSSNFDYIDIWVPKA